MAVSNKGNQTKIILKFIIVAILLIVLVLWAGWAYYNSDSAVKKREKVARRDACYADVKERYENRLRDYAQKQGDGSYQLSDQVKEKLNYLRKEEFRSCTELFPVD
jgi:Tfp pilus assembly protein PilO